MKSQPADSAASAASHNAGQLVRFVRNPAPKRIRPPCCSRRPYRRVVTTLTRPTVRRATLNNRLFRWHNTRRRPLLIREAANPWQVLVAEVMSQQTGIERVGPAWRQFINQLADARGPGRSRTRGLLPDRMGRAGLQQAGSRPPRGCNDRDGARRPRAGDGPGARVAARDRSIHRPCRGSLGVRRGCRPARCERRPSRVARSGRSAGRPRTPGGRRRSRLPQSAWSVARRSDGSCVRDMHGTCAAM